MLVFKRHQSQALRTFQSVLAALAVATLAGCPEADTYDPPAGDTDCSDCNHDTELFFNAQCKNGEWAPWKCFTGEQGAQSWYNNWCQNNYNVDAYKPQVVSCAMSPDSGSCGSWNPGSQINLVSGIYEVNRTFIAGVVSNPAPLWTCEDIYLQPQSGPNYGFKITNANSGELLYELGLRNNDIPLSLNSYPLDNYMAAGDAFWDLYQQGVTIYTLSVKRGSNTITLRYKLV
jgi:hypothetical protein